MADPSDHLSTLFRRKLRPVPFGTLLFSNSLKISQEKTLLLAIRTFKEGSPRDAENASIVLAHSWGEVPELAFILLEQHRLLPPLMQMIEAKGRERVEAGLSLLAALTRVESPPQGESRALLSAPKLASLLFKLVLDLETVPGNKLIAARW